jgi:hypothetical protein
MFSGCRHSFLYVGIGTLSFSYNGRDTYDIIWNNLFYEHITSFSYNGGDTYDIIWNNL